MLAMKVDHMVVVAELWEVSCVERDICTKGGSHSGALLRRVLGAWGKFHKSWRLHGTVKVKQATILEFTSSVRREFLLLIA